MNIKKIILIELGMAVIGLAGILIYKRSVKGYGQTVEALAAIVSVSAILPMNPKNKRLVSFALLISLFPYVWKQFPVFF